MGISEVVFLGFPDQGLEDCSEFREKLVRQIRIHKPQTVITVDPARPYIRHRDHYMCGRVTLDAVFPYARDHLAYPEHLKRRDLSPIRSARSTCFRSDTPDTFLDITDTFDDQDPGSILPRRARLRDAIGRSVRPGPGRGTRRLGKKIGVALAEEFKRIELWR